VITVGLVDDQQLVRTGFRLILEGEDDLTVVGEAADGRHAVDLVRGRDPDVVLMDIRMPVLDGLAATREILAAGARTRIIILTTFDLDEHVYAALAAGASGFLLKDVRADVLADAIRTVHAGDALLAPSVTRRLIGKFAAQWARPQAHAANIESLTAREREVLVLIARGLSNSQIASAFVVSEATVKTHVGRVFAKLPARDRAQAVTIAYETGLVTPGG
jgi:DNA-binding NarL/FixJ family response regulator